MGKTLFNFKNFIFFVRGFERDNWVPTLKWGTLGLENVITY